MRAKKGLFSREVNEGGMAGVRMIGEDDGPGLRVTSFDPGVSKDCLVSSRRITAKGHQASVGLEKALFDSAVIDDPFPTDGKIRERCAGNRVSAASRVEHNAVYLGRGSDGKICHVRKREGGSVVRAVRNCGRGPVTCGIPVAAGGV